MQRLALPDSSEILLIHSRDAGHVELVVQLAPLQATAPNALRQKNQHSLATVTQAAALINTEIVMTFLAKIVAPIASVAAAEGYASNALRTPVTTMETACQIVQKVNLET